MPLRSYKLACCVWEFTLRCNLNCIHCGSSAGRPRPDELDTEEALKLCEDLRDTGCLGVALMGGEPFLRPDFWSVASRIRELGMELSVITNGTLMPEGVFGKLKVLKPRAVCVSIDAASAGLHDRIRGVRGSYEKSWDFINGALENGLPVSVITTVHKLNLHELAGIRDLIRGRGIAWQVQTAGAEGRRFSKDLLLDEEDFYSVGIFVEACRRSYPVSELPVIGAHDLGYNSGILKNVSLYEKWEGCQAGISVLGVRSNGDIMGCLALNTGSCVEGNVRTRTIEELWSDPSAFSYTRGFSPAMMGDNCGSCPEAAVCKGGCNEMSLMKTGVLHNDPYCFRRLERKLFAAESAGPFSGIWPRTAGAASVCGETFGRLGRIFSGERADKDRVKKP